MVLAVLKVLGRPQTQLFHAPLAVAAHLLSKGSRCCADKEVWLDGTYLTYFPFSQTIEVQQMLPFHNKLIFVGVSVLLQQLILYIGGHLLV